MPSKIRLLSDHLVSQIAAGEVVERPASVVKELVENALDAGASEVRVELDAGGKRRIVVADDGSGMDRDDALLAFDRHATSKIGSFDDLQRVATLGFRGEALCSIAAVARVDLTTAEVAGEGHRVRIEGGRVRSAEPVARPRGTTIDVASLFFNVPARRKFLKSPQTELRRAVEAVQGYALARPEVRFSVRHQGRALLDALAAGGGRSGDPAVPEPGSEAEAEAVRERVAQVFGRDLAAGLAGFAGEGGGAERIHGLVGMPSSGRSRRQFVFVNRRLLRDRQVLGAFYRAVRDEWKSDEFPALFLFLDLPPEEVDVNVHPQKSEVRFRDGGLLDRIYGRLRRALGDARGEEPAPLRTPFGPPRAPLAWEGLGARKTPPPGAAGDPGAEWAVRDGGGMVAEPPPPPWGEEPSGGRAAEPPRRLATPSLAPVERAPVPLSGRRGRERPFRLLGQYKGTLILLEGPDGLYLIDQHVAHERLLYERLQRSLGRAGTPSQRLLDPPVLELSAAEHLRLSELAPALAGCGFELAPLSGNSLAVAAVPAVLEVGVAEELLRTLAAAESADEGEDGDGSGADGDAVAALRRRVLEALAASQACRAAIKMHHPLSAIEMEALVAELFLCENPYACPHGRPVVLQMSDADLERRFGRR